MRPRPAPSALLACVLVGTLTLGACSSDDSSSPGGSSAPGTAGSGDTSSVAASPYLPVPEGVQLTAQGSELKVGDDAVVAYEPRQDTVGVLDIKVTGLERTTFAKSFQGWQLDDATRKTNPYFVHVTVRNVGDTDLGGRPVPLYIVDGENTLIESSTFASTFGPCPSSPFPKKFGHGDRVKSCLVYLSPDHGELTAVSFRPSQDFDPITWTGDIASVRSASGGHGRDGNGSGKHQRSTKH